MTKKDGEFIGDIVENARYHEDYGENISYYDYLLKEIEKHL